MTSRWKDRKWPHPGGVAAAAGILLFGVHLHQRVQVAAKTPLAERVAQVTAPPVIEAPGSIPALPRTGAPGSMPWLPPTGVIPGARLPDQGPPRLDPPAPAVSLPPVVPPTVKLPKPRFGPPVPVQGPQWRGGTLPPFSPEVLRAMMDPRASRRARRLHRLGISLPPEAAPVTPSPGTQLARRPEPAPPPPAAGAPKAAAPGAAMKGGEGSMREKVAAASPSSPPLRVAIAEEPAEEKVTAGAKPEARGTSGEPASAPAVNTPSAPVRLQARLDRSRPEYRVGEWVALRFHSSQPAHLRVYRVDATGHVTRLFSTYDRDDSGQPARAFSMMVKAGERRPGQERVVAIGSARPLSRDELLDCLRSYLAEGPAENAAPAPAAAPAPNADAAPPPAVPPVPLSEALQAVIDAIGRAGDLPAGVAGLDRSAWSVAVGRFVSMPKGYQQSAVGDQPPAKPQLP